MRAFLSVLLSCLSIPSLAFGIVSEPDSTGQEMAAPSQNYVIQWGSDASAFAISPTALIASRHGTGSAGWGFEIGGQYHIAAQWIPHPQYDLSIIRIASGNAVGQTTALPGYYRIHRKPLTTGQKIYLSGAGHSRGTSTQIPSTQRMWQGYEWSSSARRLRWGSNRIDYAFSPPTGIGALNALFSSPFQPEAVPFEAVAVLHDSGGLIAVDDGGQLKAAAVIINGDSVSPTWFDFDATGGILLNSPAVLRWIKQQAPDAPICLPDIDGSETLTIEDVFVFLSRWFSTGIDWNADGTVSVEDVFSFIADYFVGC